MSLGTNSGTSLAVIRRVRPDAETILAECSNIAVYEFITAETKWNRLNVEGAAYIVKAPSSPRISLIVLNRQGMDNFVLDVAFVHKVKVQEPYIMLRCAPAGVPRIFGLWFHGESERNLFAKELQNCIPSKSSSGSSSSGTKTGGGETPTALACGRSGQVASVATTTPPPPPSAKTTTTNAATTASSAANTITSAPAASNPSGSPPGPNASSMLLKALKGGGSLTPTASDPVVVTAATATAATGGAMSPSGIRPPNAAPSPSNTTTFPHQTVCKAGSAVLPSEAYDFASRLIAPSDLRGYVRKFPKY